MAERGAGPEAGGDAAEKLGIPPAVVEAAPKGEPITDATEPAVSAAGSGTMVVSARLASELQRHSGVAGANPSATATLRNNPLRLVRLTGLLRNLRVKAA